MAIEIKTEEGAVIKFDTVEEFKAFVDADKSEDTNADVDMTNLPIGTLVKVVDNRVGHWLEIGEILPITEVLEGTLSEAYRLDDRSAGWVSVKDIEFVSFPEEEESTSGDEGLTVDEDESEKYPAVGTKVKTKINTFCRAKGKVYEVLGNPEADMKYPIIVTDERGTSSMSMEKYPIKVTGEGGPTSMSVERFEEIFEILEPSEEDSEIKAGSIVIATEDEYDITEGSEYEIKERETGTLYFHDDDGDIRHVNVHEDRLRKKPAKRGYKKGDIVYIKEEITDNFGDSIRPGVLTEFIEAGIGRGMRNTDGRPVLVKDGDLDKLTLVCRAEDRLDK